MESINKEVIEFLKYLSEGKVYKDAPSFDSSFEELARYIFPRRMEIIRIKAIQLLEEIKNEN